MTPPIADLHARKEGLSPDRSFIVQAPAGSGKTGLLTQRYLKLLAGVSAPEEILAITFTRKAANEMKERILEALETGHQATAPDTDEHSLQGWRLAREVLVRDRQFAWRLQDNPSRLQVLTIDALCSRLALKLPVLSGFGAQPQTVDDASELYLEAARRTVASVYRADSDYQDDVRHLLLHLDNDVQRVQGQIALLLSRRDRWMRPLGRLLGEFGALGATQEWSDPCRRQLESGLVRVIEDHLSRLREEFPNEALLRACQSASYAAENLTDETSFLTGWKGWSAGTASFPGTKSGEVQAWKGLAQLLLTKSGSWRSRLTAKEGFPAPGQAKEADIKRRRKEAKEEIQHLLSDLSGEDDLQKLLNLVHSLPPPRYEEDQWETVEALLRVSILAAAELLVVFAEVNKTDFVEVAQRAERALGDEDAPSELALALDARLQHILIDEFQDTSIGQLKLLERLISQWTHEEGRTLFLVGDPMQSIYRFRDAEVGLFLQIRKQGLTHLSPDSLLLSSNFRSTKRLVEWFNTTFCVVFPNVENSLEGSVPYALAEAARADRETQPVELHPVVSERATSLAAKKAEAEVVLRLLEQTWAENPARSVAILVRSRGHLKEILPTLRRAGLRYRGVDLEPLKSRPPVRDLTALTRALFHPADRVAWLSVLRAPWCGLSRAGLLGLVDTEGKAPLFERLFEAEVLQTLDPEEVVRIERVRIPLAKALSCRDRLSVRRLVEGCWLELGGPATLGSRSDLEDTTAFFTLLDDLSQSDPSLETLEERLQKLYARPDSLADERLVVMTIHKAKGLQFDTVILPGLSQAPVRTDEPLLSWLELPDGRGGSHLLLAPITEKGKGERDPVYAYVRALEQQKEQNENARVLYVAATRAERKLHLLARLAPIDEGGSELRPPISGSFLGLLWPALGEEFQRTWDQQRVQLEESRPNAESGSVPVEVNLETSMGQPLVRLAANWTFPALRADLDPQIVQAPEEVEEPGRPTFDWAGETARQIGTVVHRVLQQIGREGARGWDEQRVAKLQPYLQRRFQHYGLSASRCGMAVARAEEALRRCLKHPKGSWVLSAQGPESRCEYAVSGVLKGRIVRGVVDRTFVDDRGVLWIVDYKTGFHEGGELDEFLDAEKERYRPQLERYAKLLSENGTRPIKLGLYFPLVDGWREWSPGSGARS